jgi:hypothetical protein
MKLGQTIVNRRALMSLKAGALKLASRVSPCREVSPWRES